VSDPTNIEKNIIPQLKFWFPEENVSYETRKANKSYESIFTTKTGHEFDLMTYEQSPREFEGVTLGWAWLDEPPPQSILKAIISRMRKGGIIFITATPLAGSAYLYDMFAKGETQVEITNPDTGAKIMYVRKNAYIEADVESACKEHGIRGHLKHSDIVKMMAEYSEDERQARMYGKFQHLVGMVFKKWNRKVHVIKPFHVNQKEFCVWEMLDPHPRNPDAVLWVAIDRNGTKYVVDELYASVDSDEELAERIKAKASQYRVVKRIADPSAFNVNQHDENGKSLADRLSAYGLTYQKGTKQRRQADRRIGDALNYTEINGHMVKAPEVLVFDHCERLIFEMEHYRRAGS
jgi:phage terminase large subunit-like protein